MIFLLLILLATPTYAQSKPDTCTTAENSLHTIIGSLLTQNGYRGSSGAVRKRRQIMQQRYVESTKEVIERRQKQAAIKGIEGHLFAKEPRFFSAYRSFQDPDYSPCNNMQAKLRKNISQMRETISKQCLNSSRPNKKIYLHGKIAWSSQYFIEENIFIDSKCAPQVNNGELYSMHQLTNGFNASVENLCQAAWSGLKEVWSKAEVCLGRNGWFDIKEWAKGNIVKRSPPKPKGGDLSAH